MNAIDFSTAQRQVLNGKRLAADHAVAVDAVADHGFEALRQHGRSGPACMIRRGMALLLCASPLLAQFNAPAGLCLDAFSAGVYVAEAGSHVIRYVALGSGATTAGQMPRSTSG
jgi:hypothetical protein